MIVMSLEGKYSTIHSNCVTDAQVALNVKSLLLEIAVSCRHAWCVRLLVNKVDM